MNDCELLEYAAKAVGINITFDNNGVCWKKWPSFKWNPLDDDGDALRLAVKLKVWIEQWPDEDGLGPYCSTFDGIIEHHENDALAATRRAIVRAAAKIGKSMENK